MRLLRNNFKTVLISGPLIGQKNDPFSAIPSIPVAIPYLAAFLEILGSRVECIDAFGLAPNESCTYLSRFILRGLTPDKIVDRIDPKNDLIGISVHSGDGHTVALEIIQRCKKRFSVPLIVGGHQATHLYKDFLAKGADFVVLGEGEPAIRDLVAYFKGEKRLEEVRGIAYGNSYYPQVIPGDINTYAFPSYNQLPLENYWRLNLSHGPLKRGQKYLPLITSRGCTFGCRFCASSSFWHRHWKARDIMSVVDEIRHFKSKYGVTYFHLQDPNFAGTQERVLEFTRRLKQEKLEISWALPSGIKLDSLNEEALIAMKNTGLKYFNFSPEHGSKKILKQMQKPVDLEKITRLIACAEQLGIKKGACFIIGYYGETKADINKLKTYVKELIQAGLDEISFYIFCPVPGSSDFNSRMLDGMDYYEGLCWSPRWRKDYAILNRLRMRLYLYFLWYKTLWFPKKMKKSIFNLFSGNYELKSEMILARLLKFN